MSGAAPSAGPPRDLRRRAVAVVVVGVALAAAAAGLLGSGAWVKSQSCSGSAPDLGGFPLRLELGESETWRAVAEDASSCHRRVGAAMVWGDYPLIACYLAFLVAVFRFLARQRVLPGRRRTLWVAGGAVAAILAAVADVMENLLQLQLLAAAGPPDAVALGALVPVALLKWAALGASCGVAVGLWWRRPLGPVGAAELRPREPTGGQALRVAACVLGIAAGALLVAGIVVGRKLETIQAGFSLLALFWVVGLVEAIRVVRRPASAN